MPSFVATPPGDHVASGLAALARGVHVYVEKPLAARAAERGHWLRRGVGLGESAWLGSTTD